MTEDKAEIILCAENTNCFLVRSTGDGLILSFKIRGWSYHEVIKFTVEGFCYLRKKYIFKSIADMIAHYKKRPVDFVSPIQTLAHPCDWKCSGKIMCAMNLYKVCNCRQYLIHYVIKWATQWVALLIRCYT